MRNLLLLILFISVSCKKAETTGSAPMEDVYSDSAMMTEVVVTASKSSSDIFTLDQFKDEFISTIVPTEIELEDPRKINVTTELIKLFDPNEFDCGCTPKLKEKIRKLENNGFLPREIQRNIPITLEGAHLAGTGSNVLVHSFKLKDNTGKISDNFYNNLSPTVENYNSLNHLVVLNEGYDNLYYSMDCSGYLAGVIGAVAGVNSAEMKTSAAQAAKITKSLVVIKGLLYSPLYQALKNEGIFNSNKALRKQVLESIINKVPKTYNDDTQVLVDSNYEVILTSNEGDSSFNGKAELKGSGSYNFIFGNVNSTLNASGSIGRTSAFSKFNTYVLNQNINDRPLEISLGEVRKIIEGI